MELNCIVIDDEPYILIELEKFIEQTEGIRLIRSFQNISDVKSFMDHHPKLDVVFSDIRMPQIDGIEAAAYLKTKCSFLVYITAFRHYGPEIFEMGGHGYLIKPLTLARFKREVAKLLRLKVEQMQLKSAKGTATTILIKGDRKNNFVNLETSEIYSIEGGGNYVKIRTASNVTMTYMSLSYIESMLCGRDDFIRIHKSHILSRSKIEHIDGFHIRLKNNETFTVSRSFKKSFCEFLDRIAFNPLTEQSSDQE